MAKVVLDIHRLRTGSGFVHVPLHSILPIHPIDRGEALASKEKRIRILEGVRGEWAASGRITREDLERHLPSVSSIKVIALGGGGFVSYEGNGRLGALQHVFRDRKDMEVEVELYRFGSRDAGKILRRIDRVRRWKGLGAIRP